MGRRDIRFTEDELSSGNFLYDGLKMAADPYLRFSLGELLDLYRCAGGANVNGLEAALEVFYVSKKEIPVLKYYSCDEFSVYECINSWVEGNGADDEPTRYTPRA